MSRHTSPNTTPKRSQPCHTDHTRWAQTNPPGWCRALCRRCRWGHFWRRSTSTIKATIEPGKLASAQARKLPAKAVAIAQQLALWLPADGPLLWQLAELANAHGDVRNGAAMLEGCVVQFGMQNPRCASIGISCAMRSKPAACRSSARATHTATHTGTLAFRSRRPLISKIESLAVAGDRSATASTRFRGSCSARPSLEKPFKPTFPEVPAGTRRQARFDDRLHVSLARRAGDDRVPVHRSRRSAAGIARCPRRRVSCTSQMPAGETARYQRGLVRVVGRLQPQCQRPGRFSLYRQGCAADLIALDLAFAIQHATLDRIY